MKNRGIGYLSAFLTTLFLWNLLINSAWAADSITPNSVEKAVDDIMSTELEKLHIPGAAVVVTQEDQILFSKGYGYADLERKMVFDPAKTIVRVGQHGLKATGRFSVTGSFCHASEAFARDRGRISGGYYSCSWVGKMDSDTGKH